MRVVWNLFPSRLREGLGVGLSGRTQRVGLPTANFSRLREGGR